MSLLRKHRFLLGYVALVAVAFGASWGYTRHITHELDRHDRLSCQQRNVLAANQQDVLAALVIDITREQDDPPERRALLPKLAVDRQQLAAALKEGC